MGALVAHFPAEPPVFPFPGGADCAIWRIVARILSSFRHVLCSKLQVALQTFGGPVVVGGSCAVPPETDDAIIIGAINNTLREKLQIDVITTLNAKVLGLGGFFADERLTEARPVNTLLKAVWLKLQKGYARQAKRPLFPTILTNHKKQLYSADLQCS